MSKLQSALFGIVLATTACARPQEEAAAPVPSDPLSERHELHRYLPAPGIRWAVQFRPRKLVEDQRLRSDWESVISSKGVEAFRQATGFDPDRVEEAWIAGYSLGTLYIFDAKLIGPQAEAAFRERSLSSAELKTKSADITHLTGMIGQVPYSFLHQHKHLVAIAEGDITLTKIAAAVARGKLKNTPSALETRFVQPLADFAPDAPVRVFLMGPFETATDAVAQGFVTGAAGIFHDGGDLSVSAKAIGVWPPAPQREAEMDDWMKQLLDTRELRALGFGFPKTRPKMRCIDPQDEEGVERDGSHVDFTVCTAGSNWDSAALATSLHRVTAGQLADVAPEDAPDNWEPTTSSTGAESTQSNATEPPDSHAPPHPNSDEAPSKPDEMIDSPR